MENLSRVETAPRLAARPADAHKGTCGRVLVVAGSRGMAGAAVLCGSAAVRGGAGLVQVACPRDIQDVGAAGNPCYTTLGITPGRSGTFDPPAVDEIVRAGEAATVVAVGPGLGNRPDVGELVRALLIRLRDKPVV